jgi:Protein of unknown function (DUF4242)
MKKLIHALSLPVISMLMVGSVPASEPKPEQLPAAQHMYVIERNMPGLGQLSPAELKAASQKSCRVLQHLGPDIVWLQSYVTGDKMYCVYLAPNAQLVREHAQEGGFPADAVNEVTTIIGPQTAK